MKIGKIRHVVACERKHFILLSNHRNLSLKIHFDKCRRIEPMTLFQICLLNGPAKYSANFNNAKEFMMMLTMKFPYAFLSSLLMLWQSVAFTIEYFIKSMRLFMLCVYSIILRYNSGKKWFFSASSLNENLFFSSKRPE